jgi:predicted adenine nucleotide alpha hydrolase (AANH) superfamily ATPase
MKVLLHICCAPCTIYPLRVLRAQGHEVSGFFFNPNIHPFTEFRRRLDTVSVYSTVAHLPVTVDDTYDVESFLNRVLPLGKDRCLACYRVRMERTFTEACERKAEAVTTTLLYSKYQRHEEIISIGNELSATYGVPFLYIDFRSGWKEGQEESRYLGLYRQQYCGCIVSEQERFAKTRRATEGRKGA